jgi:hypothetical protein
MIRDFPLHQAITSHSSSTEFRPVFHTYMASRLSDRIVTKTLEQST